MRAAGSAVALELGRSTRPGPLDASRGTRRRPSRAGAAASPTTSLAGARRLGLGHCPLDPLSGYLSPPAEGLTTRWLPAPSVHAVSAAGPGSVCACPLSAANPCGPAPPSARPTLVCWFRLFAWPVGEPARAGFEAANKTQK